MSAEQRHSGKLALDEFGGVRFAGTRDKLCLTGVAISCGPRNVQAEESRDRMLACWNYCAGIPTEKLTGTLLDRLMRVEAERDRSTQLLRQILTDLPTSRDWLDPAIEREARALIKDTTP